VPGLNPEHVKVHYALVQEGKLHPISGMVQIVLEADLVPTVKENG
jgi:hypothetical protein